MLTMPLLAVLLSPPPPDVALGDVGESCRARADCRSGLRCVNAQCTAPVAQTKEGQACEATSDCSSDGSLRCLARVTEPPPLPSRSATLVDVPPPPPMPLASSLTVSQQVLALKRDIEAINFDLRRLKTGWPGGSISLVVGGAILSPLTLVGLFVAPIVVGLVVIDVGAGGIAMIVAGATGGARAASAAMTGRQSLLERRSNAERELANLKRSVAAAEQRGSAMLTLAAF